MDAAFYKSTRWKAVRAQVIARDRGCSVRLLVGGECSGPLHAHHLQRPEDGGALYGLSNLVACCQRHHPMLEAARRAVLRFRVERPQCRHRHVSREARELCEARLARQRERVAA